MTGYLGNRGYITAGALSSVDIKIPKIVAEYLLAMHQAQNTTMA